jgi:hypothetical protein
MIEKIWLLEGPYTDDDCAWIDASGLLYHVENPGKLSINDSGWCDMETGAEILTDRHKIYLQTTDEKGEMWLKLKYIDRVILHRALHHEGHTFLIQENDYDTTID